jgi:hypothetical protein
LVTGGATSTAYFVLSGPAPAGLVVGTSTDNSAAAQPGAVTILAGSTTGSFPVTTFPVAATTITHIGAILGVVRTAALTVKHWQNGSYVAGRIAWSFGSLDLLLADAVKEGFQFGEKRLDLVVEPVGNDLRDDLHAAGRAVLPSSGEQISKKCGTQGD